LVQRKRAAVMQRKHLQNPATTTLQGVELRGTRRDTTTARVAGKMTTEPFGATHREGLLIGGRDPPGERLGAHRTVAEIVDEAVDRTPAIGLELYRQMTTEGLMRRS
jgi:hypothetical protein